MNAEQQRLKVAGDPRTAWKRWGPYPGERRGGTVREDSCENGDAWNYLPHDHARSRAYKWGQDGIAGCSDDRQRLCWTPALWNGMDRIINERLFGLTNHERDDGENIGECHFYADRTPTHRWMRYVHKHPRRTRPYDQIALANRARGRIEPEFEHLDAGIFDDSRMFDVTVAFASFYEHLHGDSGTGFGASRQTVSTGPIAFLVDFIERTRPAGLLEPAPANASRPAAATA